MNLKLLLLVIFATIAYIATAAPSVLDHLPNSLLNPGYDSGVSFDLNPSQGGNTLRVDINNTDSYLLFVKIAGVDSTRDHCTATLENTTLYCGPCDDGRHLGWLEIALPTPGTPSGLEKFRWSSGTRLTLKMTHPLAGEAPVEAWEIYPDNNSSDSSIFATHRKWRNEMTLGIALLGLISVIGTAVYQHYASPPPALTATECVVRLIGQVKIRGSWKNKKLRKTLELVVQQGLNVDQAMKVANLRQTARNQSLWMLAYGAFRQMLKSLAINLEDLDKRLP